MRKATGLVLFMQTSPRRFLFDQALTSNVTIEFGLGYLDFIRKFVEFSVQPEQDKRQENLCLSSKLLFGLLQSLFILAFLTLASWYWLSSYSHYTL